MGFSLIAAGLVFLFNPNIGIFDLLPDCIGFLLIYRGLFALSFASPKLQDCRELLWKLALVTALRVLSALLLPLTEASFILVLVFVFAVLETILFFPMIWKLFDGFYELGTKYNTESVFDVRVKTAGKKIENAERLKVYTAVFFMLKTVAPILPELTTLQSMDEFTSNSRLRLHLSTYKPLFHTFCFLIVLVFGCIWLVRMLRYVKKIRRDEAFIQKISEFYTEKVLSRKAMMHAIRMKTVHVLFILASVFSVTFIMEGVDIVPSALSAVVLILAIVMMIRDGETGDPVRTKAAYGGIAAAVLTALFSVSNYFIQVPYFIEYEAMSARYMANAAAAYKTVRFFGTAEYILVIAMYAAAIFVYCRTLHKHADYVAFADASEFSVELRKKELLSSIYAKVFVTSAVGVVCFLLSAAYFTVAMYFEEIYLVNSIVSLIWIGVNVQMISEARETLYDRLEQNY